jgi:cyanophycin synthetase
MRIGAPEFTLDRVRVALSFDAAEPLRTSGVPGSAERALGVLPGLRGHRCDNDVGATFAQELADTEFAHLFEHAVLEIMALAGAPDTLRGTTSWDFAKDGAGVFGVSLEHDDEDTARSAIRLAGEVVGWAAGRRDEAPDFEAEARRLRRARAAGAPPRPKRA